MAIERLESIDPNDEYAYERAVMAFLTISKLPILIYDMEPGIPVFRTRMNGPKGIFHEVSDISLAPSGYSGHADLGNGDIDPPKGFGSAKLTA